jgi:hypothetical protein
MSTYLRDTTLAAWQNYYRALAAKTNLFPVSPQPQTPAQDVLLALSKYDAVIEELRAASRLPYSRFPLDYDEEPPGMILLPHLAPLKSCAPVLELRSLAELANGQSEPALSDIKLSLRLAEAIRTEPFLISHLVRIAMVSIALQPVYEGLAAHQWTDAQLATLDAELAKLDLLRDYQLAMRGEMVLCTDGTLDYLRRNPEQLPAMGEGKSPSPPLSAKILYGLIPSGWFYQNMLHADRFVEDYCLPSADVSRRTVSPAMVRRAETAIEAETRRSDPYNIFARVFLPGKAASVGIFAYGQSGVDLARTAIALERYRLAHSEYPETLDALAPQFIAAVPHDVIGGQPLKYRREAGGQFVLYSIGWNETDDGGVVVFKKGSKSGENREEGPKSDVDRDQGDWVWRYPQK